MEADVGAVRPKVRVSRRFVVESRERLTEGGEISDSAVRAMNDFLIPFARKMMTSDDRESVKAIISG